MTIVRLFTTSGAWCRSGSAPSGGSAARLLAVLHGGAVVGATDDLVADTGEVTHAAAADQDDGVLLEVVALAGDVGRDLDAVDEAHTGDLAEGGVRLLGGGGEDAGAHAALLGVVLQGCVLGLRLDGHAPVANELVDSRQSSLLLYLSTCLFDVFKGRAAPLPRIDATLNSTRPHSCCQNATDPGVSILHDMHTRARRTFFSPAPRTRCPHLVPAPMSAGQTALVARTQRQMPRRTSHSLVLLGIFARTRCSHS